MKQIKTGCNFALAIKENGDLVGIGRNEYAELGLSDKTRRYEWTKVNAFDGMDIQLIQCGGYRSAVLTSRGLYVMGQGLIGGQHNRITTPTRIELDGIINISMRNCFVK